MTGTVEEFHVQAHNEDGTIILPIWGPEYHGAPIGNILTQNGNRLQLSRTRLFENYSYT
jgi:hypothetical protein